MSDASHELPRIRVVAALIVRRGKALVQRRPPCVARASMWELPGGKVEEGESDGAALVRECREELGVGVRVAGALWRTEHRYADVEVALHVYRASLEPDAEPRARENQQVLWQPLEDLDALAFCPADQPLVEALARGELQVGVEPW